MQKVKKLLHKHKESGSTSPDHTGMPSSPTHTRKEKTIVVDPTDSSHVRTGELQEAKTSRVLPPSPATILTDESSKTQTTNIGSHLSDLDKGKERSRDSEILHMSEQRDKQLPSALSGTPATTSAPVGLQNTLAQSTTPSSGPSSSASSSTSSAFKDVKPSRSFSPTPTGPAPAILTSGTRAVDGEQNITSRQAPIEVVRQEKPIVLQETVHPIEKEEIQPIIYREREQTEIHKITEHLAETTLLPAKVEERTLPAEYKGESSRGMEVRENISADEIKSSRSESDVQRERIVKEPIIQEVIRKKIIEEVQPIIYREVIQPEVVVLQRPVYEKMFTVTGRVIDTQVVCQSHEQQQATDTRNMQASSQMSQQQFAHPEYVSIQMEQQPQMQRSVIPGEQIMMQQQPEMMQQSQMMKQQNQTYEKTFTVERKVDSTTSIISPSSGIPSSR